MSKLYYIESREIYKENIIRHLNNNKQIKFISLAAVDLGNNHTDEKIPVSELTENYESFMKNGIQTDGSSVFLPLIADINNAQVSLIPDQSVKWFVDYNPNHIDEESGLPVGTLVIPSYINHNGETVCSRGILERAVKNFEKEIVKLTNGNSEFKKSIGIEDNDEIIGATVTAATELEFWVNTPNGKVDKKSLMTSQTLKEQYWKRTVGTVRTAVEKTLLKFEKYGLNPEMGHKEVGGVSAKLKSGGSYDGIYEQLELDWKYDGAIQSADNEMFARDITRDIFVKEGLDVTFKPKPIDGSAGSGEHHHIGVMLNTKSGKKYNALHPANNKDEYLSSIGYAALMGILNNYEIISPFVSASNNAFKRLVPGFEAPVCTVTSLGKSPTIPSRNRTVLLDLIRDTNNQYACRFELRSPNPKSNTFLLLSACLQGMLDGILYANQKNKKQNELRKELTKKSGDESYYLNKEREYVTNKDIFHEYSAEQREKLFGSAPKTVYECLKIMKINADKLEVLTRNSVFSEKQIMSYEATVFSQWINELEHRIIKRVKRGLSAIVKSHKNEEASKYCLNIWNQISSIKSKLIGDVPEGALIFKIEDAIAEKNYEKVNVLQLEIRDLNNEINELYAKYLMLQ